MQLIETGLVARVHPGENLLRLIKALGESLLSCTVLVQQLLAPPIWHRPPKVTTVPRTNSDREQHQTHHPLDQRKRPLLRAADSMARGVDQPHQCRPLQELPTPTATVCQKACSKSRNPTCTQTPLPLTRRPGSRQCLVLFQHHEPTSRDPKCLAGLFPGLSTHV